MVETQDTPQVELQITALDIEKLEAHRQKLRPEQNLLMGTVGGLVAALFGALVWAFISVMTGYQIGYMAVAVGYLVGMGMRITGKGVDPIFGYVGATLALLGCLLGNFLSLVHYAAQALEASYIEMLTTIDYSLVPRLMIETSDFKTLIFCSIAVYEGYHFAFRNITVEE